VTGEAHYVLDGDRATVRLVPAVLPDGRVGLFEVLPAQPQVTCAGCTSVDESRRFSVVRLVGAPGRRIGDSVALDQGRGLHRAERRAVGRCRSRAALTVAYIKVRVQFGPLIAGCQALQHRMGEMHVLVESARSLSHAAAQAAEQGAPDTGLRAAAAKVYYSEALQQVSAEMIQLHGAIGMTWEHMAHRYFKRGHGAAALFGAPACHVARIAAIIVDR
jgi:alkylation response protein AidB-like acyl-CoA dehydrogenase